VISISAALSQLKCRFILRDHRQWAGALRGMSVYFPTEAGSHLLTPEGWKAELTIVGWLYT